MGLHRKPLIVFVQMNAVVCAVTVSTANAGPTPWDDMIRGAGGGELVVDQQPHNFGGTASDTAFQTNEFLPPTWQLAADDFIFNSAPIQYMRFWGFYALNQAPSIPESFSVKIYQDEAAGSGPGISVFHETIMPLRSVTGRTILYPAAPLEYVFESELPLAFNGVPGQKYWLEISQIGDVDSLFAWEYSISANHQSCILSPFTSGWTIDRADLAFQLLTAPEPWSGLLAGSLLFVFCIRRSGRR